MSGALSPRVRGLLALAGAGLIAGLASGHPELAVLATPILVFIGAGLVLARVPRLTATIELERARVLEGDLVTATVSVHNNGPGAIEVSLTPLVSPHLRLQPARATLVRVAAGADVPITLAVCPQRWGAHSIGPLVATATDPLGVTTWTGRVGARMSLRAFPREQRLRELVAPLRTQPFLGARWRGRATTGSSSPTSAPSLPAIAYGRSIGAPPPGAAPCTSPNATPSSQATSSCCSTRSPKRAPGPAGRSTLPSARPQRSHKPTSRAATASVWSTSAER